MWTLFYILWAICLLWLCFSIHPLLGFIVIFFGLWYLVTYWWYNYRIMWKRDIKWDTKKKQFYDIPWYEWLYQANKLWDIKSVRTNKILSKCITKWWYQVINISIDWSTKTHNVHKLITKTFLWDSSWLHINHKDWNKTNNALDNLEYVTRSENELHKYRELWYKWQWSNKKWKEHFKSKKILQLDTDGNIIDNWYWTMEVERELWLPHQRVSLCCRGMIDDVNWYFFKYT